MDISRIFKYIVPRQGIFKDTFSKRLIFKDSFQDVDFLEIFDFSKRGFFRTFF